MSAATMRRRRASFDHLLSRETPTLNFMLGTCITMGSVSPKTSVRPLSDFAERLRREALRPNSDSEYSTKTGLAYPKITPRR